MDNNPLEQTISICIPANDEDFKIFKKYIEDKFNICYFSEDYSIRNKWLNVFAIYEKPYLANDIFKYLVRSSYTVNYFGCHGSRVITLDEIKSSPLNLNEDVLKEFIGEKDDIFEVYNILVTALQNRRCQFPENIKEDTLDVCNEWIDKLLDVLNNNQ